MKRRVSAASTIIFLGAFLVALLFGQCLAFFAGDLTAPLGMGVITHAARDLQIYRLWPVLLLVQLAVTGLVVWMACASAGQAESLEDSVHNAVRSLSDNVTFSTSAPAYLTPAKAMEQLAARASMSLVEANRKQRLLMERAVDVICVVDLSGNIALSSESSTKAWGYSPKELIGYPLGALLESHAVDYILELITNATRTIDKVTFEAKLRRKDGTWMETAWTAHWSASEITLFCIVHDITQQKQIEQGIRLMEQKLRIALESLPVGVLVIDKLGVIEFANAAAHTMLGYQPGQVVSSWVASLFESDVVGEDSDKFEHGVDTLALLKNGSTIPVELWRSSIELSDQQKYLLVILDKSAQVELDRVKSEFIAMISHDLRNPLTSVQGLLTLLEQGVLGQISPEGIRIADGAHKECNRMLRLLNDMLELEKINVGGAFQLQRAEFDLRNTVREALENVRPLAAPHQLNLSYSLEETLCYADEQRIMQVLVNLLSNAIKFSPDQSTIEISLRNDSDSALIRITDEGRGIPSNRLHKVFERFEQLEPGDAREKGGTGLGLAICKAIVEQHGGTIGVESIVGQGSQFWLTLPKR